MMSKDSVRYMQMNTAEKIGYSILSFICNIPVYIWRIVKVIGLGLWSGIKALVLGIANIIKIFFVGSLWTKVSYVIMGFGQIFRGQTVRGVLFLALEAVFLFFMNSFGVKYLTDMVSLGDQAVVKELNDWGLEVITYKDNSLQILLYGVLTAFVCLGFIATWVMNVKGSYAIDKLRKQGLRPRNFKGDINALVDEECYKTLMGIPMLGIVIFTVVPLVFMILVAFTNYDYAHLPPTSLFDWVGLENFKNVLGLGSEGKFSYTFFQILLWTLIWALVATFSCYFLGILVAMMINKKGIKFKKGFRTILVLTIAVPQFVSLLLVSKMFADNGVVNGLLMNWGLISEEIRFLTDPTLARIMVLLINLWVGIPYLMLIATGILMNIPADLYESARIDGANAFQQFTKITMPYMLSVTGPYLLTSFVGNINNFNVIYLLTAGAPKTLEFEGGAGYTDLLITWLYTLSLEKNDYKMAAVIGILTFIVVAGISLIVYNVSPAMKNEEDFQ